MIFRPIEVADINGNVEAVDVWKQIGNSLYCYAHAEEISNAGRAIYHGEDVGVTDALRSAIAKVVAGYPWIIRKAIIAQLE